jgi:hypothetical protein
VQANRAFALKVANLQHVFRLHHTDVLNRKNGLTVHELAVDVVIIQANELRGVAACVAFNERVAATVQHGVADNGFPKLKRRLVFVRLVFDYVERRMHIRNVNVSAVALVNIEVQAGKRTCDFVRASVNRANR